MSVTGPNGNSNPIEPTHVPKPLTASKRSGSAATPGDTTTRAAGVTPPPHIDAVTTLTQQGKALDDSRAQLDPTSSAVLEKFLQGQLRTKGGGSTATTSAVVEPIYGAPIRGKQFPGGAEPAVVEPIYGAPLRKPDPQILKDLLQKLKDPGESDGNKPTPAIVEPIYGAPIRGKQFSDSVQQAVVEPIYGAPIQRRKAPLQDPLQGQGAALQMIYGAPLRSRNDIH